MERRGLVDIQFTPLPEPRVPDLRIGTFTDSMSDLNIFPRHLLHIILTYGGTVEPCDPIRISWGMGNGTTVETKEYTRLRFTVI